MEKREFEITFNFLHIKNVGYFEIADLEELCYTETKTKIIRAETLQKACNIVRHGFGKSVYIEKTREIKHERERGI